MNRLKFAYIFREEMNGSVSTLKICLMLLYALLQHVSKSKRSFRYFIGISSFLC